MRVNENSHEIQLSSSLGCDVVVFIVIVTVKLLAVVVIAVGLQIAVFFCYPHFQGTETLDGKFPCHSYYGDRNMIEPEVSQHIPEKSQECSVGFQWRSGDFFKTDLKIETLNF